MTFVKRLCLEEDGQGLMEYTLIMMLVTLAFWLGVKDTGVGDSLAQGWARVVSCVTAPFACAG
jgi:Flp pilus assembly pilin Flp